MSETAWYEPLRQTDAGTLRQAGIELNDARSLAAIRDEIRTLQNLCEHQVWLAGLIESGMPLEAQAVIGLQTIDKETRRAALHAFASHPSILPAILPGIISRAFWVFGLFRLEMYLPASSMAEINSCRQAGFTEEGRQRSTLIDPATRRHQDLVLLSLLRPEHMEYGTAFIPFRLGVYAVTGHQTGLTESAFIRYNEKINSEFQHECAEMAGILNDRGLLADRSLFTAYIENNSSIVHTNAPEPVLEAASQVQAYFSGKLTDFSLPVDLTRGSAFQTRVWEMLQEIPFGSTWTYEELAYKLTADDWEAARRMSRAVGSACSANPLPLILPCHRVIGKDGRLVGFNNGLDVKEYLLDLEIMGVKDQIK